MAIYLDHAATTPLRREALEAMLPILGDNGGSNWVKRVNPKRHTW
jgi:cysteine sulfinate desulfinase/cysteine desulfurase-like protein